MSDARFEDGAEAPLRLQAQDVDDLKVISALVQDAVLSAADMRYDRRKRQFAMLVNRYRWEDERRPDAERVRTLLVIEDALAAASQGVPRDDPDLVLSVLALAFEPGEDGAGALSIILAGDGEIRLQVECLSVVLRDVTRPYRAVSGRRPKHAD